MRKPSSSGLLRAVIGAGAENLICESSIGDLDRSFLGFVIKCRLKKRKAIIKSDRIRPPRPLSLALFSNIFIEHVPTLADRSDRPNPTAPFFSFSYLIGRLGEEPDKRVSD